ncbi:MFS transporter [Leuconostocaceae bacterium ESL0723]|nr:MFS transporter [Leuconostocaceae bacterium ESL0723]
MQTKPAPRGLNERWLLLGVLLSNTGNSMIWPITTLYMTGPLHQSFTAAGLVLMVGSLISIVGAYLGGWLFDHWYPRLALALAAGIAGLALLAIVIWNSWPVYAILLWISVFGMGMIQTLINAYGTKIDGPKTRVVFNNMYIVLNIGVVLGTLAVGYLFDYGFTYLMALAGLIYLALLVLSLCVFRINPAGQSQSSPEPADAAKGRPAQKERFRLTPLLVWIGALLFIMYLSYMLWESVMAPHMRNLGMPTSNFADLWMINGITIIVFQKFVSNWANRRPYRISVLLGSVIFASSFFFLVFTEQFWQIVIVFELLTVGEMLASPQLPAWVAQITPASVAGQAQGFVSMMISAGRVVGPVYAGVMMDAGMMNTLFLSVLVAMLVVCLGLYWISRPNKTSKDS